MYLTDVMLDEFNVLELNFAPHLHIKKPFLLTSL